MEISVVIDRMSRKSRLAICRYLSLGAECAATETALLAEGNEAVGRSWPAVFDDYALLQYFYETGAGWERPSSQGQAVKTIRETVSAVEKCDPQARALLTQLLINTRDGFRRMRLAPEDWCEQTEEELLTRSALLHEMARVADILEVKASHPGKAMKTELTTFELAPVFADTLDPEHRLPTLEVDDVRADVRALTSEERDMIAFLAHAVVKVLDDPSGPGEARFREAIGPYRGVLADLAQTDSAEPIDARFVRFLVECRLSPAVSLFRKRIIAREALGRDFPLKHLINGLGLLFDGDDETLSVASSASIWQAIHAERVEPYELAYAFDGVRPGRLADWILTQISAEDAQTVAAVLMVANAFCFAVLHEEAFVGVREGWVENFPRITQAMLADSVRRGDHYLDRFDRRYPELSDALLEETVLVKAIERFPDVYRRLRHTGRRKNLPPPFAVFHLYALAFACFGDWHPHYTSDTAALTGVPESLMEKTRQVLIRTGLTLGTISLGPVIELVTKEAELERGL